MRAAVLYEWKTPLTGGDGDAGGEEGPTPSAKTQDRNHGGSFL
jgi:hypothetical protein